MHIVSAFTVASCTTAVHENIGNDKVLLSLARDVPSVQYEKNI